MKPGMIGRGIIAGFVGTVVLSAMMLMKHSMGLMPEMQEPAAHAKAAHLSVVTVRSAGIIR